MPLGWKRIQLPWPVLVRKRLDTKPKVGHVIRPSTSELTLFKLCPVMVLHIGDESTQSSTGMCECEVRKEEAAPYTSWWIPADSELLFQFFMEPLYLPA